MKALNGFLMTQRQIILKDECGWLYNRKLHRPRMSDAFLADNILCCACQGYA